MEQSIYEYSNMIVTDREFKVPLDYENPDRQKITIFAREILRKENKNKSKPYLIFFQGYYNAGAAQCRIGTYVNGVHLAMDHNNSIVGTLQMHLLINCSANDYIEFKQIVGNTQAWYQGIAHMLGYIVMLN